MERRRFLESAAVGSVTAGWLSWTTGSSEPTAPSLPRRRLEAEGWQRDDERSETFTDSGRVVTTSGITEAYVDEALAEELSERTLGEVRKDTRLFFATGVTYDPPIDDLPFGVGRGTVIDATASDARNRFERRLEETGLESIDHVDTRSLEVADGSTADLYVYEADRPFEGFTVDAAGETLEFDGGAVETEGLLAVWYSESAESTLVGGAIHPAENVERSVERDLSDGVVVGVDLDLGFEPETYHEEAHDLIRAVS